MIRRSAISAGFASMTLALVAGCDPPPAVVVAKSAVAPSSASNEPAFVDPGVFTSKRFGMRLALPRSAEWKIDDHRSKWLFASQPREEGSLLIRLFSDENRMNREKCEATARSLRKLPRLDGAELVSEQPLDVPPGFDTRASVALAADPKGAGIYGFIVAFGGRGRRCFAYTYVTRAEGPGADEKIADRLAEMVEGSLKKLQFESDLDAVLERERTFGEEEPPPPQR